MRTLLLLLFVSPLFAAPVPADAEKPKSRPKLLGSARLDVDVNGVLWTPDGKHLILRCGDGKAAVVRRDQLVDDEPAVKAVVEFKLPDGGFHLALAAGGSELYSVVPAKRFNSESRLLVWELKRVLEAKESAKADRVVTLEPDSPYQGALSADGKHLLTHTLEPRRAVPQPNNPNNPFAGWNGGQQSEYTVRFVRLSAKTGDLIDEIAVFDDPQLKYVFHAVDPKAGKLFVQLHTPDETVIRCYDAATGKQAWERKLEQKPTANAQHALLVSPDGGTVGVVQSMLVPTPVAQPGGGGRGGFGGPAAGGPPRMNYSQRSVPMLLSAKTGETPVELPSDDIQSANLYGFSADGRLLVGSVNKDNNASQVVVWDTKTGKVVKAWGRMRNDMHLAFAPTGYELFVAEVEAIPVYGPSTAVPQGYGQGGQQWTTTREVIRTDHKAVVGVWDLSPLAK